jgi:hypothetical protein
MVARYSRSGDLSEVEAQCPQCGFRALVSVGEVMELDLPTRCEFRQEGLSCPKMRAAIATARETLVR